jgi:hypothetical protein
MNSFFLKFHDENTPRPLFSIDENFNFNHGIEIPFLKTKRVKQNEGFS